jgi:hypothetical protein
MADYPISNVTRRVVYVADGVGPYAFTFEILAQTDVAVFKDDTLLTLTTDYTVVINANGTGTITLTAVPTGATQIAIVGARAIQRLSDFTTGGDFFANTVNQELDSITIFTQQNAEAVARALQAPQTDPATIDMTLPRASVRADKYLSFDDDGNPVAAEGRTEVAGVFAIRNEIVAVAGISTEVVAVDANEANINTVAGINANVTTVAGISGNVTTVATNTTNVNTVATNIASVNTVSTNIANVNNVGGNIAAVLAVDANEADIDTVAADLTGTDTIGTVAGSITDVNTVGTNIADVTEVADNIGVGLPVTVVAADLSGVDDIGTVASSIANVNTTAGSITSVNTVAGEIGVSGDVTIVATDLAGTDTIGTVATSIVNVNTVGTNIANVNTVAGISANVTTVSGIAANVTTVAGISANVTTVAGISADVTAVAGDAADIGTVAADLSGADTIGAVAASITNVNTVATNVTNVNTVATNIADVGTVAGISADVSTVADISTNVTTVAGVAGDLNAVALTVAPVEALLPIAFDIPTLWWDTGERLLSGASERIIISNWQVTSLFDTEEGAWYDTYDASELGGATSPGDTVPSFGDKSGNSNDATGTNVLYATVPKPALYNNKVSSRMVVDLPYMGTNATIGYCSDQGVTILTGRTVGGPTDILHDRYLFGYVVIDRALTAQETLRLTQYLESRKFGYVAPAEYDGAMLLEDGFSLLMENDDRVDLEGVITWPLSV